MAQEIADSTLLDTWASSGLIIEPDISKIIEGWQLGEQPPHEYMNWLQNTFGSKLNHILKNGIALWNNETEYLAGSSVQHNGNVWLCKTTNTNSEPTELNNNWDKMPSLENLALTVDTINDFPTSATTGDTCIVKDLDRGGIFIYDSTKVSEDNQGTNFNGWVRQYSGAVNVKWFGAHSIDKENIIITNGKYSNIPDSFDAIQTAIDFLYNNGGGTLVFNGIFGTSKQITIKNNVSIVGTGATGFFNSGLYYSTGVTLNNTTAGSMIVATSNIVNQGVIGTEDHSYRNWNASIKNIVICANRLAEYALYIDLSIQKEHSLYLNDVSCELAIYDGIRADNAVAMVWDYVKSYANGRYGLNIYSGTTDCSFNNLYIHTNDSNGILLNNGSMVNVFTSSKIEDNYSYGVSSFSGNANFIGCVFQNNDSQHLELNSGSSVTCTNCSFISNNTYVTEDILINTNSFLGITNSSFGNTRTNNIKLTSGTLQSDNNRYSSTPFSIASGTNFTSNNDLVGTKINNSSTNLNNKIILCNTSSTASSVFKVSNGGFPYREYWDMLPIMCIAQYTEWGGSSVNHIVLFGITSTGGGSPSVSATVLNNGLSASMLSSINCSYNVSTREITISVTTGATWATGGRASAISITCVPYGFGSYK